MDSLTITLYGSVRGKSVAALAHAYCLTIMKLSLAPAAENAPWKVPGKHQDMFTWRKAMVAERDELERTLADLFNGEPIAVGDVVWPLTSEGRSVYDPATASVVARNYAMFVVKALGLSDASP